MSALDVIIPKENASGANAVLEVTASHRVTATINVFQQDQDINVNGIQPNQNVLKIKWVT